MTYLVVTFCLSGSTQATQAARILESPYPESEAAESPAGILSAIMIGGSLVPQQIIRFNLKLS